MEQVRRVLAVAAVALSASWAVIPQGHAAETVTVFLDEATLIKLPERAGTLIVGNPLIADIAVQAGGTLVVTGRGYGATNLIALDRQGHVLMEKAIQVEGPRGNVVVVFRGVERETYSCLPRCEKRITLGDGNNYFSAAIGQAGTRNTQAQGAPQQAR